MNAVKRWALALAAFFAASFAALAVRRHLARREAEIRRSRATTDSAVGTVAQKVLRAEQIEHLARANDHAFKANVAGERARERVRELQDLGADRLAELVKRWNGD